MARNKLAGQVLSWVWTALAVVIAAVFLNAAAEKLIGEPVALAPFTEFGWPLWLATATAIGEILGAVALIIPGTRTLGGAGLTTIMLASAFTNIANGHPNYLWLNAALGTGSVALAWQGRKKRYRASRQKRDRTPPNGTL